MPTNANILTASQNSQLFAIKSTSRALNVSQNRLATGNRVNSPLDNPQNFFKSFSLSSRASDLSRLLDGVGQSVNALKNADSARSSLENIISQAQTYTQDAKASLKANQQDLGELILADNPDIYYRLDETSGTRATNLGTAGSTLNGRFRGGVSLDSGALTFSLGNASSRFNGTSGRVEIPNNALVNTDPAGYAQRTVELTFSADSFGGKQVLFEEGGTGNSAAIYLDDDRIYFVARDAGDFGPFNISAQVETDRTYQASFVLDSDEGTFIGYLDGEVVGSGAVNRPLSRHGGAVALGRNAGGTFFHDGANGGNGEYFEGRISDFALYNSALTQDDLKARFDATQLEQARVFEGEVINFLAQADSFVDDAGIGGINLLQNNDLLTNLNENGTSSLLSQGQDLSTVGLGFAKPDFSTFGNLDKTLFDFEEANTSIQDFGRGISNDLSLIEIKQNFISSTINTLNSGSDDLTLADVNEEASNLLALQTQQQIQSTTLSLSTQGSNIGDLLAQGSFLISK